MNSYHEACVSSYIVNLLKKVKLGKTSSFHLFYQHRICSTSGKLDAISMQKLERNIMFTVVNSRKKQSIEKLCREEGKSLHLQKCWI